MYDHLMGDVMALCNGITFLIRFCCESLAACLMKAATYGIPSPETPPPTSPTLSMEPGGDANEGRREEKGCTRRPYRRNQRRRPPRGRKLRPSPSSRAEEIPFMRPLPVAVKTAERQRPSRQAKGGNASPFNVGALSRSPWHSLTVASKGPAAICPQG